MAIPIGQRDEDIEGIPRQRKKIVWFRAFTAEWRHGTSLPVCAIAINGVVARRNHSPFLTAGALGGGSEDWTRAMPHP